MSPHPAMLRLREEYHRCLAREVLRVDERGVPNNADRGSETSKRIAAAILREADLRPAAGSVKGQEAGRLFEMATNSYLEKAFALVGHLRPGSWVFSVGRNIREFAQFRHLTRIRELLDRHAELRAVLGDYIVKPDIVVARHPVTDEEINRHQHLVERDRVAAGTPLREVNSSIPLLHASVSCKWTIRSDRSQNARTEALNLIRHRKGNSPHIALVTAEPLPGRLASIALGTGDMDCVYQPVEKAPRPRLLDRRAAGPHSFWRRGALSTGRRRESLRDSPRHLSRGGGHPLPAPLPGRRSAPTNAPRTFSTGRYHFALPEMRIAVAGAGADSEAVLLDSLIEGDRLRDVSDLPFDLAV